ncbi:MAG: hypothetical protein ABRQ38_26495 [Candidatus Eremiobacterota bacterium]
MDFFSKTTKTSASFTEILTEETFSYYKDDDNILIYDPEKELIELIDKKNEIIEERIDINLKKFKLSDLLTKLLESGGSELYLEPESPPIYRINGDKIYTTNRPLSRSQIETLLSCLLTKSKRKIFENTGTLDLAYEITGLAKFHVTILCRSNGPEAIFKYITETDELKLPTVRKKVYNPANI